MASSPLRSIQNNMSPTRSRGQASPQSSPKPLQERGASARNVQPPRSAGSIYNKAPFPKHASQILSPEDAIYVDENATSALLLPKLLSLHSPVTDSVVASPETVLSSPETIVASPDTLDDKDNSQFDLRQSIDLVIPSYEFDPDILPPSTESSPALGEGERVEEVTEQVAREVRIEKRASSARLSDYSIFPSERLSQPRRISLIPTNPRIRSQSNASSNNWQAYPGTSPESSKTPDLQRHRRASSSPITSQFSSSSPAGGDGLGIQGIQYSESRIPSTANVDSTPRKTFGRRLQRKRAVSNFGQTARFSQHAHSRTSSVDTGMQSSENWAPTSMLEVIHDDHPGLSVSPVPEEVPSSPSTDDVSQHWDRGRSDHVQQIQRPAFVHKPSFRHYDTGPDPSLDRAGPVGSFYNFLNDSYTAWARIYYGAEGTVNFNHSSQASIATTHSRQRDRSQSRTRNKSRGPARAFSHFSRFSRSSRSTTTTTTTTTTQDYDMAHAPAVPRIPQHMMQYQASNSSNSQGRHSIHRSKASNLTQFTQFSQSTRPQYHSGMPEPQQYPLHLTNVSRPPTSSSYSSWTPSPIDSRIQSPGSGDLPEMVYVPRVRPRVQEPVSVDTGDSIVLVELESRSGTSSGEQRVESQPASHPHANLQSPHLARDRRSLGRMDTLPAASFEEHRSWFDRVNRQIVLFCIGFIFPLAWILAAILPIPHRPSMRSLGTVDDFLNAQEAVAASAMYDLFDTEDVIRYQKARRWRLTNRIMSVVGLGVVAVIGACAGVAAR